MKLSHQDVRTLGACARKAFDVVDHRLKSVAPPVATNFGCTAGLGVRLFSYIRVQTPEPIVLGVTVLQGVPEGLVVHADAVADDSGHILLSEPPQTLLSPTIGRLKKTVETMSTQLCRRAIDSGLLGPRPRR